MLLISLFISDVTIFQISFSYIREILNFPNPYHINFYSYSKCKLIRTMSLRSSFSAHLASPSKIGDAAILLLLIMGSEKSCGSVIFKHLGRLLRNIKATICCKYALSS